MNCKHAAWLMSLRQDRPLKLGENLGLRLHLSYCPGCRAYRQQLDFLQRACRAFTPPESTEAPPAESDTPPRAEGQSLPRNGSSRYVLLGRMDMTHPSEAIPPDGAMPPAAPALSADKKILLIVYASQTGRTARLAQAVADGARAQQEIGVQVHCCQAPDATLDTLLAAHALVLATPENFGYMAGLLKDFLDRTYTPAQGRCQGLPYAIVVSAGNDGRGAMAAIERIAIGYGWRSISPALRVVGEPDAAALAQASELGAALASGLACGVF